MWICTNKCTCQISQHTAKNMTKWIKIIQVTLDTIINHESVSGRIFNARLTLTGSLFFSNSLGISHNLISFMLEILHNCSDKAKSSSFLYQSEENATIITAKIIGMFKTWNIHSFSLCKMNSQKIFSKSILRRQRQTFRIPKKKRFTIEFCRYHQMNHHWPCPNVREKMRKIYRVIRLRCVDGLLV